MRFIYIMSQPKAYIFSVDPKDCAKDKWDYGLLKETFDRNNTEEIVVDVIPECERAFVVIPGKGNTGKEKEISEELNKIGRVVLFITGDEENLFDVKQIKHDNCSIWIQYPTLKHERYNKLPIGVPKHLKDNLPEYSNKVNDICFAGQITHQRRQQLASVMPTIQKSIYKPTDGFAKGSTPKEYYKDLISSKIVPSPAGVVSIDSFRLFEAIEMMCVPIADTINSKGDKDKFYNIVFGNDFPIPKTDNWKKLQDIVDEIKDNYPNNMHQIVCWWLKFKRDFANKIMREVYE